ncbi:MAG: diaminopimelate decarboxylase, partial [Candidatus Margulisiibacteriota bacterium]
CGLHSHLGAYITNPGAYAVMIEKMLQFAYFCQDNFSANIDYLDIGGGFPSSIQLKKEFQEDAVVPGLTTYIDQIIHALQRHLRPDHTPRLILENGRALVDDAGFLIATVNNAKELVNGHMGYTVDAGVNILFAANWYTYQIESTIPLSGGMHPSMIFGPLCMQKDILETGRMLPWLPRGTHLVFSPAGAYNWTHSMQFIQYRPNTVLIRQNGATELIRKAETLSDVEQNEILPEDLVPYP